jgi:hypothetical protein
MDGIPRDIPWQEFQAGKIRAEIRAEERQEDESARAHRQRQVDAMFGMFGAAMRAEDG